jgi:serine/threonine-protein kinase RsbW
MALLEKGGKFQISLKSVPESVVEIERMVDEINSSAALSEDMYGNVLIALTEAVNNAIIHGNRRIAEKLVNVEIGLSANGRRLVVVVEDQGEGFDHLSIADPTLETNLQEEAGRGVFLMKQLSDMVVFSKNGAMVEMHFRL